LVVSTSAIDCLERLVSEMTCYVSSGTLNPTHSLTQQMTRHLTDDWPAVTALLQGVNMHTVCIDDQTL